MQSEEVAMAGERSFEAFVKQIRESCEIHAKRKGYRKTDINGENEIADFMHHQGLGRSHGVSEIIYKALEFHKAPRRVLLEKIAGWCFIVWQRCDEE